MWRLILYTYWLGSPQQPVNPRIIHSIHGWFNELWAYDVHPVVFFLILLTLIGFLALSIVHMISDNGDKKHVLLTVGCFIGYLFIWQWETHPFLSLPAQLAGNIIKTVLLFVPLIMAMMIQLNEDKKDEENIVDEILHSKIV